MDRNPRSNQFLVSGLTVWLSFNLIRRWLYTPIFFSAGPYGIPQPSSFDQILVVLCSILNALPFALLGLCLGMLHERLGRFLIAFCAFVSLLALEGDFGWYVMSKSHINIGDLVLFATQNWHDHFGIQDHDITRFCLLAMVHAAAVAAILFVDYRLRNYKGRNALVAWFNQLVGYRYFGHWLLLLFVIGQCVTMFSIRTQHPLWGVVASANPFYVSAADKWWHGDLPPELMRLNEQANAERQRFMRTDRGAMEKIGAQIRPDILFVTVESWNANFVSARDMPFFSSLEKSCYIGSNHYSGANQTELGVLSLLYGEPDVFFRGYREYASDVKQSSYIAGLSSMGYRIGRVVGDASQQNTIPRYLAGFNEAEVVDKNDWNNIQQIVARLSRPGPDFIHAHYFQTHYPYIHAKKYSMHQPETPSDFSYQNSDLSKHRSLIINRYKNALSELDAWIENLLSKVDLNQTIIVITGDHGEEIFETGRLGHAATLEAPQVHTPLAICGPHAPTTGRSTMLSSHADVFPTVFDMLGIHNRLSVLGKSLFKSDESRLALIAQQNHGKRPVAWAMQSTGGKLYLVHGSDGRLAITGGDPEMLASLRAANKSTGAPKLEQPIVQAIVAAEKELNASQVDEKAFVSSLGANMTKVQ